MKYISVSTIALLLYFSLNAQVQVNLDSFNKKGGFHLRQTGNQLQVSWSSGDQFTAAITLNLTAGQPLIHTLQTGSIDSLATIATDLEPVFVLTRGKRDLVSQNGWNIFFDKTAYLPHQSFVSVLDKKNVRIVSEGSRIRVVVGSISAGNFSGDVELTLFEGSPLLNIAAVMQTQDDSVAVLYDAGLVSNNASWQKLYYNDPDNILHELPVYKNSKAANLAVKYRSIAVETEGGSMAVFPAPHQYFPPLDNCYNLQHAWYGSNYQNLIKGYGIGIRQDPLGDRRWVPWFNAPPGTAQRFNFFCLLSIEKDGRILNNVKAYTHGDTYQSIKGYYTFCSHFHVEHTDDVLTHKPLPEVPGFVKAFKQTGVNIVHLAEFHGPGDPKGPDVKRLEQLNTLFKECSRLSGADFLLLPGEEPNNFYGGHWVNLFPKPVYWVMSRNNDEPFIRKDSLLGDIYHIKDKTEMLRLMEQEHGLAWTAHPRTKGSVGFPDGYKNEDFYLSNSFNGAAWKSLPADLSQPRLGKRALDVLDDMNNWRQKKKLIAEADLFKIEPGYELYAHLNVNYLQLNRLPSFNDGWQPVLDALSNGKYFSTTGEILLPYFKVNDTASGDTAILNKDGKDDIGLAINWTFPLQYAEIISGDGKEVYREKIVLTDTKSFGSKLFHFTVNLKNRKWVRLEVWDAAINGAFTQTVWLRTN